jgi:hypothetical protein
VCGRCRYCSCKEQHQQNAAQGGEYELDQWAAKKR